MKWILLLAFCLPAHAAVISYEMTGTFQPENGPGKLAVQFDFDVDSNSGLITFIQAYVSGDLWSQDPDAGPAYIRDIIVDPDGGPGGPVMHWLGWSPVFTYSGSELTFGGLEWKVPYLGAGSNPFSRLEQSVTPIAGASYIDQSGYGTSLGIKKVPEPATLSLLALGLAAIGIRRRLR